MKIVSFDKEKMRLELTSQELTDLWRAITTLEQEYDGLDLSMLQVPEERISALAEALGSVLQARAAQYTTDRPSEP